MRPPPREEGRIISNAVVYMSVIILRQLSMHFAQYCFEITRSVVQFIRKQQLSLLFIINGDVVAAERVNVRRECL